jgi:hypothetical protein
MSRFGYSPDSAEKAKTQLDRELAQVEFHLGRIAAAVPQAGAITSKLGIAEDEVREVVSDLHDVITERTDGEGGGSCAGSGGDRSAGGSAASDAAAGSAFRSVPAPGAASTFLPLRRTFGFDYWDEPGIGMEAA